MTFSYKQYVNSTVQSRACSCGELSCRLLSVYHPELSKLYVQVSASKPNELVERLKREYEGLSKIKSKMWHISWGHWPQEQVFLLNDWPTVKKAMIQGI